MFILSVNFEQNDNCVLHLNTNGKCNININRNDKKYLLIRYGQTK